MKKIIIAYTSKLFSDGLACVINDFEGFTPIKSFQLRNNALDNFPENTYADILILEVNWPSKSDQKNIERLLKAFPNQKIVLLSFQPRHDIGIDLIESGISAYMLKSCGKEDLLAALHKIAEGTVFFCSEITKRLISPNHGDSKEEELKLTDREKEILGLLVKSYSNKQIAIRLNLSENTIKSHRKNIHAKFGVSNLIGLVRYACRSNLIDFGNDEFCAVCPYMN